MPSTPARPIALLGALNPGLETGLIADVLAARALGRRPQPVCTSIVSASPEHVTDVTEAPADTVRAQLEHLFRVDPPAAVKVGVLGTHQTVEAVSSMLRDFDGPVLLDFIVAGEGGGTVLTGRGVEVLKMHLAIADITMFSRTDAELLSGGEINSLDDAQVAAQRLHRLGARAVLITCGVLPARFFDADDPHADSEPFMADLLYDGRDFGLFEAPRIEAEGLHGASSALGVALLDALLDGQSPEVAAQRAKRYVTEAIRHARSGRLHFSFSDLQ